jgi:signal transduction histidine kinase/PAS domain-containing protein
MVASAARVIGAHFGAQRCGFVEGDGECAGSEVTLTRGWRRNGGEGVGESEVRRLEDFAPEELVRVPASGEVVVVSAPHSAAAGAQDSAGSRTPSVLAAPYLRNGSWRGVLVVVDDRPREWGRENEALLREAATSLGMRLERAYGEEALRASEERYRTLYEAIDESYAVSEVLCDEAGRAVDYRFLQVNEAFVELTGLEDPVGRTARELVPDVEPVWIEQVGAIAETGEPRRWVAEVRALGRWYDNFGFRLGAPDDRLVAVLSRDITMEKRAERALQATATRQAYLLRLNDALRPLTDPVVIQEVACRILGHHLDVAWVQYSELDLEREIIENTREFYRGSEHPEDLPSHVGVYDLNAYPGHAEAWRSGWSMVVDDVETDPSLAAGERERLRSASVRATLTIPLMKDGAPVVVMSALSHRSREWTAEDVGMLEETAERTWAAVGRARAEAALQRMNERLEARVAERTREVRQLAETLSLAEHAERQRLSHLLHDDLQQLLFGIQMKLGLGRSDLRVGRAEEALAAVERSIELLDEALTRTRQLTVELNPPVLAGEGLMDALEWLRRQVWDLHRLRIRIRGSTGASGLPADQRVLLFQIVRELLFNVAKHAGTDGASVEVERGEEGVGVVVRDAGRGFDPERLGEERRRSGFGLVSARERLRMRGGELVVDSAPGRGTRVELRLPADSP